MTITAKGVLGARVTFDGHFIEISKSRFDPTGGGTKRIPVHAITAVQLKRPGVLTRGFIQFTIPGGNEVRSSFGRQAFDAAADENAVVFTRKHAAQFVALRAAIEQAIEECVVGAAVAEAARRGELTVTRIASGTPGPF